MPAARFPWVRYLAATLLVGVAIAAGVLLAPFTQALQGLVFLGTVAVSAWWLGLGPSLLTTVLAALAVDYFFVPPLHSIDFDEAHVVRLVTFVAVSVLISGLNESLNRARQRAEASAREAERELAERRRVEADLRRASEVKDEFLATLSHELRTPLTAVLGWSQMLRSGRLDAAGVRRAIESIDRSARAQAALVNDILDVSRIVKGKLTIVRQPVHVTAILGAALDAVQPAADAKGLELVHDYHGDPVVSGDPDRLQQIFWNLLSNATKFTPRGGRVSVTVAQAGHDVEVRVEDTGEGISPAFLPHVFDTFRQADASSARDHAGLGLGLTIVRSLVELHGGSVVASSRGEGRGAVFAVRLPVPSVRADGASVPSGAGAGAPVAAAVLAGLRVLIVDDDGDVREVLQMVLGQAGAEVTAAESGESALAVIPGGRWDLIVSDLGMPRMDGYEFIRRLRALPTEQAETPAVALTAYGREDDRLRAIAAGFQQHVAKPIVPDDLVTVLLAVVAQRAAGKRQAT